MSKILPEAIDDGLELVERHSDIGHIHLKNSFRRRRVG
jgi:hypothetical protein